MHGAVLLDAAGEVVRPSLIWCDQRTEKQSRELSEKFGTERLIQLTCNPPLTNFTLTKILWVRENQPQLWARVRHIMLPKDYVRFRLTGDRAIDQADASGTLLFDVAKRAWSAEVVSGTGIEKSFLPTLYESPEVCGTVNAEGASATGLKVGTPVVAGAGDQAAGAVGMGIVRAGVVSATIGTSGVVFAATDRPALDPRGRLHTFCQFQDAGTSWASRKLRDSRCAGLGILLESPARLRKKAIAIPTNFFPKKRLPLHPAQKACSGRHTLWANARHISIPMPAARWSASRHRIAAHTSFAPFSKASPSASKIPFQFLKK